MASVLIAGCGFAPYYQFTNEPSVSLISSSVNWSSSSTEYDFGSTKLEINANLSSTDHELRINFSFPGLDHDSLSTAGVRLEGGAVISEFDVKLQWPSAGRQVVIPLRTIFRPHRAPDVETEPDWRRDHPWPPPKSLDSITLSVSFSRTLDGRTERLTKDIRLRRDNRSGFWIVRKG